MNAAYGSRRYTVIGAQDQIREEEAGEWADKTAIGSYNVPPVSGGATGSVTPSSVLLGTLGLGAAGKAAMNW